MEKEKKFLSYKLDVLVEPKWDKILVYSFPELESQLSKAQSPKKFIDNFIKKEKINPDFCLFSKSLNFTEFFDGVSGVNIIFSKESNTFLNDLEIKDSFLVTETGDYFEGNLGWDITISPNYIRDDYGKIGGKEEIIDFIPFDSIIKLLIKIYEETGEYDFPFKRFSNDIEKLLKERNIFYSSTEPLDQTEYYPGTGELATANCREKSKWFKENGVEFNSGIVGTHHLDSPYSKIIFKIKFFEYKDKILHPRAGKYNYFTN